jgi:Skp family chaperone for outer membrane proteins
MRKEFLLIFTVFIITNSFQAQTKGTKVGYIDMEYILQNVPDYAEAQNQLEQKAQKWKQEIEAKKNEINKLKEDLKTEKVLLTKSLIEERESEIALIETEILDYQQKRFGPNGDLMVQKNGLTKPIQDQVFTAVQDIATAKKYDFIFDRSSDMTMLFAAKRFDISDQIIKILNRTEKREQLTKKQLKEEEARDAKEEAIADNPNLSERQKVLDEKKAARNALVASKLEERKKAAEDRKLQIIEEREAKKNGTVSKSVKSSKQEEESAIKEQRAAEAAEAKQAQADQRAETLRIRQEAAEERKKASEERRQQILDEREAKKTAALPANTETKDETANPDNQKEIAKIAATEAKQKQAEERAKTLEDRKKAAEDNKKAQEEKRKQTIALREAKKNGTVSAETVKVDDKIPTATETTVTKDTVSKTPAEEAKQKQAEARAKATDDRNKILEERRKALEEKRKKILEDREVTKKANK